MHINIHPQSRSYILSIHLLLTALQQQHNFYSLLHAKIPLQIHNYSAIKLFQQQVV